MMYSKHENKPYNRFLPVIFIVFTMCACLTHKVDASDVEKSFAETDAVDGLSTTAVNTTNTSFFTFS